MFSRLGYRSFLLRRHDSDDDDTTDAEGGKDVSVQDRFKIAIKYGDVKRVKALLRKRADVKHDYGLGLTPLHFAALNNRADIVRVLVGAGANIHATTTDECGVTAGQLARQEEYDEVTEALCEDPPAKNAIRRRFVGPCLVASFVVTQTLIAILLGDEDTRWDGWRDPEEAEDLDTLRWRTTLALSMAVTCLASLVAVNSLDPGAVDWEDVAHIDDLRCANGDEKVEVNDGTFAIMQADGSTKAFRWCHTCKFWKPESVSHCAECKRCFWRFDHHCLAVGNCIAARNHCFFTLTLVSGGGALGLGVFTLSLRLFARGALASVDQLWPPRLEQWPMYLFVPYLCAGVLCSTVLLLASGFHVVSLVFNINTKMVLSPSLGTRSKHWLNRPDDFRRLFCMQMKWRACGPPMARLTMATPVRELRSEPDPRDGIELAEN